MIWPLIPAALGRFSRSISPRGWYALAALVGLLVLLAYCTTQARQDERAKAQREHAEAYARALERETAAKENAARERVTDFQNNTTLAKERADATAAIPDTRPSDLRIARGCQRLREQGLRTADLPFSCRP